MNAPIGVLTPVTIIVWLAIVMVLASWNLAIKM
jgi:hypothetical protein